NIAFVFTGGVMYDLSSLVTSGLDGMTLFAASGINDSGQIAATGTNPTRTISMAFRLDPQGSAGPPARGTAIEYYHAAFRHYFITAIADEISKLDSGVFDGWARTGQTLNVYTGAGASLVAVCRFFTVAFPSISSHFYAAHGLGCEGTLTNR